MLCPLKGRLAHDANPLVEKSECPPHTQERRRHPDRHQPDYRNPISKIELDII